MEMSIVMSAPGPARGQKVEFRTAVTGTYNKTVKKMN